MPFVTRTLIIANVIAFLLSQVVDSTFVGWLALWPVSSGLFMPWQTFTYAFLHANLTHLLFNMYGLWMFGADLERLWGTRRFAVFYTVSLFAAALVQLVVTYLLGANAPTVGASGAIFGLLLGFGMVFPQRKIVPLLPPIPMPAWLFVMLYGLVELALGVTGSQAGVAHFAHLGGLLGGWLVLRYWRGQLPFSRRGA